MKLKSDHETEVAVIGGGLAGLLCAYELRERGYEVCVIEKNKVGSGATSKTTAFITAIIDTRASELIKMLGAEDARSALEAGIRAIDRLEEIIVREGINCDFKRVSANIFASSLKQEQELHNE